MATALQSLATRTSTLRLALQADALVGAIGGIGLIVAASPISAITGLPALELRAVGAVLIPYVAWLWYAATRPTISRRVGWAVVAINTIWAVDSLLLLFSGWLPLTDAGWWFILAQAVVVAAFADWQAIALYRSRDA